MVTTGGRGLEIHLDEGGKVFGFGPRRSKRHRDRLADVTHFACGQDRPIGRLEAGQLRSRAHPADAGKILGQIDAVFEPARFAYGEDTSVGVGAAYESGVQRSRQLYVGAKLAAPFEKTRILEPRQPGANPKIARHRVPRRSSPTIPSTRSARRR